MKLSELLAAVHGAKLVGPTDPEIRDVTTDSRQICPGDLFVAVPGTAMDGSRFLADAFAAGASAAAVQTSTDLPLGRSGAVVPNARLAYALACAAQAGWPSRELRLVGVTGTDGKTTTAGMLTAILEAAGRQVGSVTTVAARIDAEEIDTGLHTTTPDAHAIQGLLSTMRAHRIQDAVLEVTSHALEQHRVGGCDFDVAVLTNITPEHLDYHHTFERYRQTKLRLFESLAHSARKTGIPKAAIYNAEDPAAPLIDSIWAERHLRYALDRPAEVRAQSVRSDGNRTQFEAQTPIGTFVVQISVPGRYNVANALAAIAAALALDIPPVAIQNGLAAFAGVTGRLEEIEGSQPFRVIVDFAHTPNSLQSVLTLVREQTTGQVHLVFGCAGERDATKRPKMGAIAGHLADKIYLTAEDPRHESLDAIIAAIADGCRAAGREENRDFWRIADRGEAIHHAISSAHPGDVVLMTGKGHERSLAFGAIEHPWSDQEAAKASLRKLGF